MSREGRSLDALGLAGKNAEQIKAIFELGPRS